MADRGRPSKYTQETADKICEIISSSNRSLANICKEIHVDLSTVFRWMNDNEHFCNQYARAKELQADFLAEEIIEIADDSSKDTIDGAFGPLENKEWTNRSKLRVDARKWVASKLKPKKYGDKLELDGNMSNNVTVDPSFIKGIADKINANTGKG